MLQRQVHETVEQTKRRSGWSARRTLAALGVSQRSYYRWLASESWLRPAVRLVPLVQAYEALAEEKAAVIAYALAHSELRHRELAWRMLDENVVCLSPSTVYRILKEAGLLCPWRRRSKRSRTEAEKATRPDQRWSTDLMEVRVGAATYFFVSFLDEYSRYLVHHELLFRMDGKSVSQAAQRAIETLGRGRDGQPLAKPEIRSDNGSGYVSQDFRLVLTANGLGHHRITPHCPEENGLVERSMRTMREALEGEELTDYLQAQAVFERIVRRYNNERLHRSLGYQTPAEYYRGDPRRRQEERKLKLSQARHRRREANLKLPQPTLPLATQGTL